MTPTMTQIRDRLIAHDWDGGNDPSVRRAAVAVIFREIDNEPEILLIKRADYDADPWSGHMAFPGGHLAPGDLLVRHAAERETLEEIGIDLADCGCLIGTLRPERPMIRTTGLTMEVVPVIYELDGEPPPCELNHEVAEVHWAKIGPMLRHENLSRVAWDVGGARRMMPGFDVNGRIVWGMTFRMLNRLFSAIHPDFEPLD